MKEIIVKIADEDSVLVTQLLEKLGAEVSESKPIVKKSKNKKTASNSPIKKKSRKISPTFLFGKWKGLDIDAKKLRNEAWDRSHKFW